MRLKKASAWYYNKGQSHVVVDELGITINKGDVVDLFKSNPSLTWDRYHRSATTGVLWQKRKKLVPLPGPPRQNIIEPIKLPVPKPIPSRSNSSFILGRDSEDYLAVVESEFSEDSALAQEEMWNVERDKYMKTLDNSDLGEDGEVFSDRMFDEEYLDDVTD